MRSARRLLKEGQRAIRSRGLRKADRDYQKCGNDESDHGSAEQRMERDDREKGRRQGRTQRPIRYRAPNQSEWRKLSCALCGCAGVALLPDADTSHASTAESVRAFRRGSAASIPETSFAAQVIASRSKQKSVYGFRGATLETDGF
jgi:hypothetical protein